MKNEETETKKKFKFVIVWKGRYFGLDFENREIRELTFKEAFGHDFFDWDNNICLASDYLKQRYEDVRGLDGCGLFRFFNKRNDLRKMELEIYKEYEEQIKRNQAVLN